MISATRSAMSVSNSLCVMVMVSSSSAMGLRVVRFVFLIDLEFARVAFFSEFPFLGGAMISYIIIII
jgi:hypothetical protein